MAVPIAIHLWNKRPPQTVLVGSIRWLQASQSQKLSRLQLSEPWLLLFRCLLLVVLALVLAQPFYKRQITAQPERHAYLHPAMLQENYLPQIAKTVDSLAQNGWRIHLLTPGFPNLPVNPETSITTFQADASATDTTNAWALLRVLNRSLPAHAQAWVFSTDLLRHHRGEFPALAPNMTWVPVSVPQTNVWLQEAFYTTSGQLRLQFGKSNGQEVTFLERKVPKPVPGQILTLPEFPSVRFSQNATLDSLTLQGGARNSIPVTTAPLRVLVRFDQARQADVRYLKAALQTALNYRGAAVDLTVSSAPQAMPTAAPHWVFWLTDEPLAPFLASFPETSLKTLQDAPTSARIQKSESWLQIPGLAQPVSLHQRVPAPVNPAAAVLWQDGFGQPMLTQEQAARHTQYRFYSRFHPAWNALVDNGHFPELLLRLLFPENTAWKTLYDARTLPAAVEIPRAFSGSFLEMKPKTEEVLDLKPWLVALAALLLALERWLAGRRGNQLSTLK